MPVTLSSKRYTQVIFEIALGKNELAKWQPDLKRIAELAQDSEVMALLENPKDPFELKTRLAQE